MKRSAVLLLSCPDRKGVVASVAGFIYQHGGNILHADEHSDIDSNVFLMRVEFDPDPRLRSTPLGISARGSDDP